MRDAQARSGLWQIDIDSPLAWKRHMRQLLWHFFGAFDYFLCHRGVRSRREALIIWLRHRELNHCFREFWWRCQKRESAVRIHGRLDREGRDLLQDRMDAVGRKWSSARGAVDQLLARLERSQLRLRLRLPALSLHHLHTYWGDLILFILKYSQLK